MNKKLWEPRRRIERTYENAVRRLLRILEKSIIEVDDPQEILRVLSLVGKSREFEKYAQACATRMTTQLYSQSGKTWREAARTSGKGRKIYTALKQELSGSGGAGLAHQIARNAEIISSLSEDLSKKATHYIAQETAKGRRAKDIANEIKQQFPDLSENQAKLIAKEWPIKCPIQIEDD